MTIEIIAIKNILKKGEFLLFQLIRLDLFLCLADALIGPIRKNTAKDPIINMPKKTLFKSTSDF